MYIKVIVRSTYCVHLYMSAFKYLSGMISNRNTIPRKINSSLYYGNIDQSSLLQSGRIASYDTELVLGVEGEWCKGAAGRDVKMCIAYKSEG